MRLSAGRGGVSGGDSGQTGAEKARRAAALDMRRPPPRRRRRDRCRAAVAALEVDGAVAELWRGGGCNAAATRRRRQGRGAAARVGCWCAKAVGAFVGRARPLLRAGFSGAAFAAAAQIVGDAAARRRGGFSSMLGYGSLFLEAFT